MKYKTSRFIRMFGCDTARIIDTRESMFLVIGWNHHSKGEWTRDGKPIEFDYVQETTIASGRNYKELLESAKCYKRLCKPKCEESRTLRFGNVGFATDHGDKFDGDPVHISKAAFDAMCYAGEFVVGPFKDQLGDGYGDMYNPYRQAAGITKDRRLVFCELHPDRREEPRNADK